MVADVEDGAVEETAGADTSVVTMLGAVAVETGGGIAPLGAPLDCSVTA